MFLRKKATPNALYYRYLLAGATVSSDANDVKIYSPTTPYQGPVLPRHQRLMKWINEECADEEEKERLAHQPLYQNSFRISKKTLQHIVGAPGTSLAEAQSIEFEITDAKTHPLQEKVTIKLPLPRSVIERDKRSSDEKKPASDASLKAPDEKKANVVIEPPVHFITDTASLTVAQQKVLLRSRIWKETWNRFFSLFHYVLAFLPTHSLKFISGLHPKALASLSTRDQANLLQFTAENASDLLAILITKMPYDTFKKALRRQGNRTDRRTAYHDAAQCFPSETFLKLICECHTKDPKFFFRMLKKQDIDGQTVLHLAAQHQRGEVILALLKILSQSKDAEALLKLETHYGWSVFLLVTRFQTSAIFAEMLPFLSTDFVIKSMEENGSSLSLINNMAFKDGTLKALSDRLGQETFLSLLSREKNNGVGLISRAMCSIKNFTWLCTVMHRQTILNELATNIEFNSYLNLETFLGMVSASESISLAVLDRLKKSTIASQAAGALSFTVFFKHSAKVISILLNALEDRSAVTIIYGFFAYLIYANITQEQKIALIEKVDPRFLLAPEIFGLLIDNEVISRSDLAELISRSGVIMSPENFPLNLLVHCKFLEDLDAKHWKLLTPYFSHAKNMCFILHRCSDNMLITLIENAKEEFLKYVEIQTEEHANMLHYLLHFRNNKTLLTIFNGLNEQDWKKIDAILPVDKKCASSTGLHFACNHDEKVFELFVQRSSVLALAETIKKSGGLQSFLRFALPTQTPAVIAQLLRKLIPHFASLFKSNHGDSLFHPLHYQMACYLIYELSWRDLLKPLFNEIGQELTDQLSKLPSDKIPYFVKVETMRFRQTTSGLDSFALMTQKGFFQATLDEKKSDRYAEQIAYIKLLIKSNQLAIKIIHRQKNWVDFVKQLADYHYRPNLRVEMDKKGVFYKFFHMEKTQACQVGDHQYKNKLEFKTTKKHAVSLVSQTLATTVFGENHPTADLVGLLIEIDIHAIKALFSSDRGTYQRRWVSRDKDTVLQYQRDIEDCNFTDFEKFCAEVEKYPNRLNEILMKLTRESIQAVVIVRDTPQAIVIAKQRQLDLKGIGIDVPIVCYDRLMRAMRPMKTEEYASEQKLKI